MSTSVLNNVLGRTPGNYIYPFLWMKGESQEVILEELDKITECGIRAICIESRPHPDFLGDGWWADMDLIVDYAKKHDMKIWLLDDAHFPTGYANHLIPDKYPERRKVYINYNCQDIRGAKAKLTMPIACMMQPKTTWMDLGKPRDPERDNNRLISVTAYPLVEDAKVDTSRPIDLLPFCKDGYAEYTFPKGNWRIFTVYETRTDGGDPDYINIIDEESVQVLIEAVYESHYQRYKDDFGTTFTGFFSDEPGFGNTVGFLMDDRIGVKKMPLPWNKDVPVMLAERLGTDWAQKLGLLWNPSVNETDAAKVRLAYMDIVSTLYSRNFSGQLGRWCEERGVMYVGHVIEDMGEHARVGCGAGHYFRAMRGQHIAGIDTIGQQIEPNGADTEHFGITSLSGKFYHYVLSKLGPSSGHIDPNKKGRTLCEAYGAYGWVFGVRDMKWLTDYLLASGVNHFVPHAFSMAEYPDHDCPPHFYARGNNPQFRHFTELMKYTNRMADILNGGRHGAKVAVLYQAEAEWMGDYLGMEEVAKALTTNQIDFDFLPLDVFEMPEAYDSIMNADGTNLFVNGQIFDLLLVPYAKYITNTLADFIAANPRFDVRFIEQVPEKTVSRIPGADAVPFRSATKPLALGDIAAYAKKSASLTLKSEFPSMLVYDYERSGKIYMLFNTDLYRDFDGDLIINGEKTFILYDGMKDSCVAVPTHYAKGKTIVSLKLPVFTSCLLVEVIRGDELPALASPTETGEEVMLDLSRDWIVSACRSIDYPDFGPYELVHELAPYSDSHPAFSGFIRYEKTFECPSDLPKCTLNFEHIYENVELWIDHVNLGKCICPPYRFTLPDGLSGGLHKIRVEVATTPDREQLSLPQPPFRYIFEALEPTGMFGKVTVLLANS